METNSDPSSFADQNVWKTKLNILIEQTKLPNIADNGKSEPSLTTDILDEFRKQISSEMAQELKKVSNMQSTSAMKAARYGNYSTMQKQITVGRVSIEPVCGKTILHMVIDGICAFKYKNNPAKICMENIIAGKELCESIICAYFPPDNFSLFPKEKPDHYKCLEFILKNIPPEKLDINFLDSNGNSALHYAVTWSQTKAVKVLLQAGAYTCEANNKGVVPLKMISPSVLEEYLDSCILSNEYPFGHDDFQIYFNYKMFVPPKKPTPMKQDGVEAGIREVCYEGRRESEPIFVMRDTPDLNKLLVHPVIRNYLCLKWLIIQKYSFIEDIFFSIFFASLPLYFIYISYQRIFYYCPILSENDYRCIENRPIGIQDDRFLLLFILPLRAVLLLCIVYRTYFSPKSSILKSPRVWLQLVWFVLIFNREPIVSKLQGVFDYNFSSTAMIILFWIELVAVIGRIPACSISIEMLKVFLINSYKYLIPYYILMIILANNFVIFFNQLNPSKINNTATTDQQLNSTKGKGEFVPPLNLFFWQTFLTMLKDNISIKTYLPQHSTTASQLIFFAFCFFTILVFQNLVLVVPLTYATKVMNETKTVVMNSFLHFVAYVETTATRDPTQLLDVFNKLLLWLVFCIRWCLCCSTRNPPETFCKRISVTYPMKNCEKEPFDIHNKQILKRLRLDPEIFEDAVTILKRTKQPEEMKTQMNEFESRLENIEAIVQNIQRIVQDSEVQLRKNLKSNSKRVIAELKMLRKSERRHRIGAVGRCNQNNE
ncbi:transient receptor potential cation channel protein painless-like [Planococcus citri]|uniref:transient receptor potential cation channel protein painless-like n=1 Tax=Planococcus citri TaxID=170843 RepID=UPI0031FA1C37